MVLYLTFIIIAPQEEERKERAYAAAKAADAPRIAFHRRILTTHAETDDKRGAVCYAFTVERRSL